MCGMWEKAPVKSPLLETLLQFFFEKPTIGEQKYLTTFLSDAKFMELRKVRIKLETYKFEVILTVHRR